jgi:hypothetical protein
MKFKIIKLIFGSIALIASQLAFSATDLNAALRRAQYLLNGTMPTDQEISEHTVSETKYKEAVDEFLQNEKFYEVMIRYHEKLYGVGLEDEYLEELQQGNIDQHSNKIASVSCERTTDNSPRFRCGWESDNGRKGTGGCSKSQEMPARAFWYKGVTAWVCPSVLATCGSDLSRCFIKYYDQNAAKSSELGATEIFDSSVAILKSLSRQPAGIAAAVVVSGYPYTKVLEPGLTAVDGALAHLYRQKQHFDLSKMSIPARVMGIVNGVSLNHTKFQLVYTGATGTNYEQAGVLSSFGWLRRYEKNRTRANNLYQRMLCRQFTSELPLVFPQDPGNLRVTPGCSGCHATLDPLSDFFAIWGEGGALYQGQNAGISSTFAGKSGDTIKDLANIIRNDNAFGTCAVENAWTWLMGREFYHSEADLRAVFTSYFATTNYNFKELVYAIATHPAFLQGARGDAVVSDPLAEPPLGEPPGGVEARPCSTTVNFTADILPKVGACTSCHGTGNTSGRVPLATQADWTTYGNTSVGLMTSGSMPPGQAGPPLIGSVYDLKELVRCWKEQNP